MVFAVVASVVTAVGSAAYGAKQSRKAQKKAQEAAETQALIEGSAPSISNVREVVAEDIQGTQAVGLEEALAAMDYEAQAAGEEVPIPGEAGQNPMGDISEEELMLMMQSPELMGLGAQETQYAASGGAVGTPEDVYYFGVPQIMGMMQDPNPQIQGVGMQLADQMSAMPDAGMVPATANQIQTMAYGGAVTAKKFDNGGATATEEPNFLEEFIGVTGKDLDWARSMDEKLYPGEGLDMRGDAARHLALGSLIGRSNYPEIGEALATAKEYVFFDSGKEMDISNNALGMTLSGSKDEIEEKIKELIESKKAQYLTEEESYKLRGYADGGPITAQRYQDGTQGGMYDPELDVDFIAQQEAFEELLELNELAEKGVISDARAEHDRLRLMMMLQTGRTVSDLDRKNLKGSSRKKANGGPITSERLNQLRLR